jgi:hypothetical protein
MAAELRVAMLEQDQRCGILHRKISISWNRCVLINRQGCFDSDRKRQRTNSKLIAVMELTFMDDALSIHKRAIGALKILNNQGAVPLPNAAVAITYH